MYNKNKNGDNLCCPRGVVTALTYHKSDIFKNLGLLDHDLTTNEVKKVLEGDKYKMQKQLTEKLINIYDITIPEQNSDFTLEDIEKIEIKLDIQIIGGHGYPTRDLPAGNPRSGRLSSRFEEMSGLRSGWSETLRFAVRCGPRTHSCE
jgi:hypothetical protein